MTQQYSREQIYSAMREADKAGDGEAVRALARLLQEGASQEQINAEAANRGVTVDQEALTANIRARDAGRPTNTFVEDPNANRLAEATAVTAKGLAKAAAGPLDLLNDAASGIQSGITYGLTEIPALALDAFGAEAPANALRQAGQARLDGIEQAGDRLSVRNALDRTYETPEGLGGVEFGSELISSLLLPTGPRQAPRIQAPKNALTDATGASERVISGARDVVEEGARRRVPVMTTDVKPPRSGMGRYIKQTIPEKIPLAGTSGPRLAQQEARQRTVREVVEEFGGDAGRELLEVGDSAVDDIANLLTTERAARIKGLKGKKDTVIDGIVAPFTNAPNTVREITKQIRELRGIDDKEFAPVIERLQRFGEALTSGKSLRQVEEQRRLLGEMFADGNLATIKTRGQTAINKIYGPLRQDMGDFIEIHAGTGSRMQWSKANEKLSAMAGELKSTRFRNVLRDSETTPEAVSRILFGDLGNVSDMSRLVANLPPAGKKRVQAAIIQRAFDRAGGVDGVSVEQVLG
jgi:hypothetical protein